MKKVLDLIIFIISLFVGVFSYAQPTAVLLQQADENYNLNNYPEAQKSYLKVIQKAQAEKNMAIISKASMCLAHCYYFLYDHSAAFKWSYHALNIARQNNLDTLLTEPNYFLGALYIESNNVDSAEKYSNEAIKLSLKVNNFSKVSQTYSTLAELHLNTSKDPIKVENAILNAEKYATLSHNKAMMAFAKSKRYNYAFFLKKNYHEALTHINIAEKLYLESGNREAILNAYRGKAECLIMLRDTSARLYMLRWFNFKDSILQAEKAANIAKYETLYETEKKENENIQLVQENERSQLILLVVVIAFLLFAVFTLWILNRTRLKKKEQELKMLKNLQQDKERIARDLHDNVGGQLSYIIYSLDGINDEDKGKRTELAESIHQATRSVITSLRETIWAISDANIVAQDFADKLKVFTRTLFKHTETQVTFTEDIKTHRELNALLGLNLYRICQEILNNAFKYAKAGVIKIHFVVDEEKLKINIEDNGVGFETTSNETKGYGFQNIRKRAEEFGFTLHLQSEIGKGTRYEIIV